MSEGVDAKTTLEHATLAECQTVQAFFERIEVTNIRDITECEASER